MRWHILGLLVVTVLVIISAEGRELCVKPGCKDLGCMDGLRFPNGEIGYGRLFDCCDPGQRGWYTIVERCGGPWPRWWDRWWLDATVPFYWGRVSSPERRWDLDSTAFDIGAHAPSYDIGETRMTPVIRGGIGRADAVVESGRSGPLYSGAATLLSAGAEIVAEPCADCGWSFKADMRYRTLRHADRYQYSSAGAPENLELRYSAFESALAVRYAFSGGRFRPTLGIGHTNGNSRIASVAGDRVHAELDLDRLELIAGVDIGIGRALTARLEHSFFENGDRTTASLRYHFRRCKGGISPGQ